MNREYTKEEIEDIKKRETAALEFLKKNNLTPACMPQLVNMVDDTFGIKLHPFLQDTKYTPTPSPIQA